MESGQEANDVLVELARDFAKLLASTLRDDLKSIVLYGSVARGEAGANSDIDLFVVAENLPERRHARNEISMQVEDLLEPRLAELRRNGRFIDFSPILATPVEAAKFSPLYLDMTEDAIILYDRDGFFGSILDRVRQKIAEYGSRRVQLGKIRYWDLKPDYRWGEVISFGE